MAFHERKFPILFVLFIQPAVWSPSTSKPIKTVQLSPWNDDTDWSWLFTTPRPNWPPTFRPFIWPTWKPYTIPQIYFTIPPNDFTYKHKTDDVELKIIIFVPTLLVSLLILLCKYYVCNKDEDSTNESRAIIHAPPSRTISPPENRNLQRSPTRIQPNPVTTQQTSQTETRPQNSSNPRRTLSWTHYNTPTEYDRGASNSINTGDKPPGYFEVVVSDLIGSEMKFSEVSPKPPESPPPKYSERDFARY